jgi:DNA primase
MPDIANRIDWSQAKASIDIADVATSLMGPAAGRRGGKGRLWWRCPFHDDKNPSFTVNTAKHVWKCYGCGLHGDAADLVIKLKSCSFSDAKRFLLGNPTPCGDRTLPSPAAAAPSKAPGKPLEPPSGLSLPDALSLVEDAQQRLWTPEGASPLAYLRERDLEDETIKAARLGWTPGVMMPTSSRKTWRVSGITIPWFDRDRLAMVNVRRLENWGSKYVHVFRDGPRIYPGPSTVQPGKPLIVCEGEFDALLVGQELADFGVSVISLGSASSPLDPSVLELVLKAPTWYLALDADEAGDKSAAKWPARARRVRTPAPHKDWTDFHRAGFNNIRYVWGGILKRPPTPWPMLEAQRWGNFDPSAN